MEISVGYLGFTFLHKLRESERRIQELEAMVARLKEDSVADKKTIRNLMTENDTLKGKVNKLHDMYFGRKKRWDVEVDTPMVVPQEVTSSVEPAPEGEVYAKAQPRSEGERHKRRARPGHKGYGRKIPMDIACEEVIHEVSEEDSVCSCCGESYVDRGVTEESIEIQGKILVTKSIHVRRRKVRKCDCEDAPKTVAAPKPVNVTTSNMVCRFRLHAPCNCLMPMG